jgi:hypothetical protein
MTQDELNDKIMITSTEFSNAKASVLRLEQKLNHLQNQINQELHNVSESMPIEYMMLQISHHSYAGVDG